MATITVTETIARWSEEFYKVEVSDDLTPEQKIAEAIRMVREGEADDPYDTSSGDCLDYIDATYEASPE